MSDASASSGTTNLGALLRAKLDTKQARRRFSRGVTKSELIAASGRRFPQLVAKDAEFAVKMILDAMAEALAGGQRIEIRGFGSFSCPNGRRASAAIPSPARRCRCRKTRAALQGRQGVARARRFRLRRRGQGNGGRVRVHVRTLRYAYHAWVGRFSANGA